MIAAVGHTDLTRETLELVEAELRAVLERLPEPMPGLVRVGAGTAVAFARAARAAERELVVVVPTQGMVPALLPERDRLAVGELVSLAQQVRLLEYDPANRDACVGADEQVIAECGQLLAIWDGSPSDGRDATAHQVAYARALGVPVRIVWPQGAARAPLSGARVWSGGRPCGSTHPTPPTIREAEHRR
jgi:hypothetical protein